MLDAYIDLMNDDLLLADGIMGRSRVTLAEGARHATAAGASAEVATLKKIHSLREAAKKNGKLLGDGLIRSKVMKGKEAPGEVVIWVGFKGDPNLAFRSRARLALAKSAAEAYRLISRNPGATYVNQIGTSTFSAKAIPYRSKTCLKCHSEAKVGDTAAIAAVILGTPTPVSAELQLHGATVHKFDRNIERVYGIKTYPGPLLECSFGHIQYLTFGADQETGDSVKDVIDYFSKLLKAKSQSYFDVRVHNETTSVQYEFGDVYFGSIRVRRLDNKTHIQYDVKRFLRPGDLGTKG